MSQATDDGIEQPGPAPDPAQQSAAPAMQTALSADPEPPSGGTGPSAAGKPPVIVKKYANRRLYNTESSSYITLDTLADMVRHGRDFVVYDAKTAEDITRSVLTQIIVEEESKGRALLPTAFLRQLIGFYGDSMQTLVPKYLEHAMASFARQQESVRVAMQSTMQSTLGNFLPFGIEEVRRQNLAMMERAMTLFSPFSPRDGDDKPSGGGEPAPDPSDRADQEQELRALRAEVEALRQALASGSARPEQGGPPAKPTDTPAAPASGPSAGKVVTLKTSAGPGK